MNKTFLWEGIDNNGLKTRGECYRENISAVEQYLEAQSITPLKIKPKNDFRHFFTIRQTYTDNLTQFSREFSTLISAGIPLSTSLDIMVKNTEKKPLRILITSIKKDIENGYSLSEAFQSKPKYFDEITCSLIQVAEQSGQLASVLDHIATYKENAVLLKKKMMKAFSYPAIVLLVACMVTAALLLFVIPQFSNLFSSVGAELPVLTRIIITLANYIQHYWFYGILTLSLLFILFKFLLKCSSQARYYFCLFMLKIPVFGNVLKEAILSRCFKTLAMTLNAGLPLLNALQLTAQITGNIVFTTLWQTIANEIYTGQSLQQALKIQKYFPNRVVQLIGIGEETGRLTHMLMKLDHYYSERVSQFVSHLNQFLEPAIMIFLAMVIGVIVVSVYLPVFQLGSVI